MFPLGTRPRDLELQKGAEPSPPCVSFPKRQVEGVLKKGSAGTFLGHLSQSWGTAQWKGADASSRGFTDPVSGNTGQTQPGSSNSLDVGSEQPCFLTGQTVRVEAFWAPGNTCPCATGSATYTKTLPVDWFFPQLLYEGDGVGSCPHVRDE